MMGLQAKNIFRKGKSDKIVVLNLSIQTPLESLTFKLCTPQSLFDHRQIIVSTFSTLIPQFYCFKTVLE